MRTSVFFFVYEILLSIYAQIYNSSPTYRGRRILTMLTYCATSNKLYENL